MSKKNPKKGRPQQRRQDPIDKPQQAAPQRKPPPKKVVQTASLPLLFGRENWVLFAAGLGLILLGFYMMSGGGSPNPGTDFNQDELYHPMRITVAPLLVVVGIAVEIVAIMWRRADKPDTAAAESNVA